MKKRYETDEGGATLMKWQRGMETRSAPSLSPQVNPEVPPLNLDHLNHCSKDSSLLPNGRCSRSLTSNSRHLGVVWDGTQGKGACSLVRPAPPEASPRQRPSP